MNKEIFANIMKLKEVGLGAKFIRVSDEDKYLYSKVNYGMVNAIKIYDGSVHLLSEEENIILVIE